MRRDIRVRMCYVRECCSWGGDVLGWTGWTLLISFIVSQNSPPTAKTTTRQSVSWHRLEKAIVSTSPMLHLPSRLLFKNSHLNDTNDWQYQISHISNTKHQAPEHIIYRYIYNDVDRTCISPARKFKPPIDYYIRG